MRSPRELPGELRVLGSIAHHLRAELFRAVAGRVAPGRAVPPPCIDIRHPESAWPVRGIIQIGKRLFILLCLNQAVGENRQKSDLACGIPSLGCMLQCYANVFPGSLQITVIERRYSKLR